MIKTKASLKRLIGRLIKKMKEAGISWVMTLIPLAFVLVIEGLHQDNITAIILFIVAGIIAFFTALMIWKRIRSDIAKKEGKQEQRQEQMITELETMNHSLIELIVEIRQERNERSNKS